MLLSRAAGRSAALFVIVLFGAAGGGPAVAEPYLAVRQGLKCAGCHVNPTGGGMRNAAGNAFAQNVLPARRIGEEQWLGDINRFIAIGGNLRTAATAVDYDDAADEDPAFDVDELRVFLDLRVIPDRLSIYVDHNLTPDEDRTLEAYARLWLDASNRFYVKAGQMYLPFGLRLEVRIQESLHATPSQAEVEKVVGAGRQAQHPRQVVVDGEHAADDDATADAQMCKRILQQRAAHVVEVDVDPLRA